MAEGNIARHNNRLRVVILNYNRASLTLSCVLSVLGQEYEHIDIVVVDNNSNQEEFNVLRRLLPAGVVLVRADHNLGYAAGNNMGIKLPTLPHPAYVMFMNNDVTLPDVHTCRKLIAALKHDPKRVACSPLVNTMGSGRSPEYQIQVRRLPNFYTMLIAGSWWLRRIPSFRHVAENYIYYDLMPYPLGQEIDCDSINGSCFVARVDFLEEIGYLDEGTFLYEEEIILAHQIRCLQKKASLVTSTVILHEQGATSGQQKGCLRLKLVTKMIQSQIYYSRKYLHCSIIKVGLLVLIRSIDITSKLAYQISRNLLTSCQ